MATKEIYTENDLVSLLTELRNDVFDEITVDIKYLADIEDFDNAKRLKLIRENLINKIDERFNELGIETLPF